MLLGGRTKDSVGSQAKLSKRVTAPECLMISGRIYKARVGDGGAQNQNHDS